MNQQGLLLCARYSVAPNYFGYCGPDKNKNLIHQVTEKISDKETLNILSQFETLYPYLQLIARENKVTDPFHPKVVEAYWIGNKLLEKASLSKFISFLDEKLQVEKKVGRKNARNIKRKISTKQIYPHHSFHVLNIFKHTNIDLGLPEINVIDNCRIGFGKIRSQNKKTKTWFVEMQPMKIVTGILTLGKPEIREVRDDYKGKIIIKDVRLNQWVSIHWGFICDKLSEKQVKNLAYYTQRAIDFYNSSI